MSDQEFEITTKETTTGVTIVSVNGFLDAQTFEIMELKLSELIRDRKTKLIIKGNKIVIQKNSDFFKRTF